MKKRLYTTLAGLMAAAVYFIAITGLKGAGNTYSGGEKSETISTRDTFTNCIFNTAYSEMKKPGKRGLNLFTNLDSFKALNFNSIHWYDWLGSSEFGRYDSILSDNQRNNFIDSIGLVSTKGLMGFYERSFLSYYCYGQRLIYEVKEYSENSSVNNGFVYEQCMNNTYTTDEGRTVLHARPILNNAGYLCRGIYENLQHTDLFGFRQSDEGLWHLKPVMKIPENVHDTVKVVRIEIIPFDGLSPVKTIDIKAVNFKSNGVYSGGYIEKFNLPPNNKLEINGKHSTDPSLSRGMTSDWWKWDSLCKVDFRVYWYGVCEVWFDKMIVDDERANKLFDTFEQFEINNRINQEVTSFTSHMYSFFMDEITYSQIPCMQYVIGKMQEYNPHSRLSFALTNYLHVHGLKNDNLGYQKFYESLNPSMIQLDAHKFIKFLPQDIGLPDVITKYDPSIPGEWFEDTTTYNSKLQNIVFGSKTDNPGNDDQGSLIYEMYKLRNSNPQPNSNVKYIIQPHIHGYLTKNGGSLYSGGLREPTNEEIQAQAMVSIAHGADGICWYIYGSEVENKSANNRVTTGIENIIESYGQNFDTILYTYALLDTNYRHRIQNCYHQDKWSYVSAMNGKIEKWRSVLEEIKWTGGYSVHNEGANHNFISDIRSIYRNPSGIYSDEPNCINCDDVKYWEMGFFEPDDLNNRSKYLIM